MNRTTEEGFVKAEGKGTLDSKRVRRLLKEHKTSYDLFKALEPHEGRIEVDIVAKCDEHRAVQFSLGEESFCLRSACFECINWARETEN